MGKTVIAENVVVHFSSVDVLVVKKTTRSRRLASESVGIRYAIKMPDPRFAVIPMDGVITMIESTAFAKDIQTQLIKNYPEIVGALVGLTGVKATAEEGNAQPDLSKPTSKETEDSKPEPGPTTMKPTSKETEESKPGNGEDSGDIDVDVNTGAYDCSTSLLL